MVSTLGLSQTMSLKLYTHVLSLRGMPAFFGVASCFHLTYLFSTKVSGERREEEPKVGGRWMHGSHLMEPHATCKVGFIPLPAGCTDRQTESERALLRDAQ